MSFYFFLNNKREIINELIKEMAKQRFTRLISLPSQPL